MVTVVRPTPLTGDRMTYVKQVEGVDTRLTLPWFLQADPRGCREAYFADLDEPVREAGLGRVELVAPFVPTVPGTDRYADRLRWTPAGRHRPGTSRAPSARTASWTRGLFLWCLCSCGTRTQV
jgi:hypothetical protein